MGTNGLRDGHGAGDGYGGSHGHGIGGCGRDTGGAGRGAAGGADTRTGEGHDGCAERPGAGSASGSASPPGRWLGGARRFRAGPPPKGADAGREAAGPAGTRDGDRGIGRSDGPAARPASGTVSRAVRWPGAVQWLLAPRYSRTGPTLPGPRPSGAPEPSPGTPAFTRSGRVAGALAGLPLGLLAAALALGRHVRPSADEWCFLPLVRDHGITGLAGTFYLTDNGRIANGLLVGVYARFPVAGHQWFAPLSGALVLLVLWAVTRALLARARLAAPRGVPLLAAATATAVFLLATPNTYKTLYWPAASVSHTLPPVLAAAALLPALRARGRRGRAAALATAGATGLVLGTLSEETSVVVLTALAAVLLLAGALLVPAARRPARHWALAGIAGTLAGTLVLVTSPGSRARRSRHGAESASMLSPEALLGAARAQLRILETVLTTWQYAGALAAGLLLGLLARPRSAGRPFPPRLLAPGRALSLLAATAGVFLVSGYLCAVITRPVFGDALVTTERTWNDYLLLYAALLTGTGLWAGRRLHHRVRRRGRHRTGHRARHPAGHRRGLPPAPGRAAAAAGALVLVLAVAGLAPPLHTLGGEMAARASRWDRQDAFLRAGAARGATVLPYTPNRVARMLEPFGDGGRRAWPARCVADHYGLDAVTHAPATGRG
jgi:hypothetical protein